MGLIKTIDSAIRKLIFSIFWFFINPLEQERLYGELVDIIDRNLDASNPERLVAPDNFDVLVNNKVFIKHAHSIKKLESYIKEKLRKYVVEKDYELPGSTINLQISSSATVSKHKTDIRCWFPSEDEVHKKSKAEFQLKITEGEGKGQSWNLQPGKTYKIGRLSTANICLPYDNISKNQATLYFMSDSDITIVDEGSANGTFVNDESEPLKGSRQLSIGSKIKFCRLDPIVMTFSKDQ